MDFHMNNTSSSPSEEDSVVATPRESPIKSTGAAGTVSGSTAPPPAIPPLRMDVLDSKPQDTSALDLYDSNASIHTETDSDQEPDVLQEKAAAAAPQEAPRSFEEEEEECAAAAQEQDMVVTEDVLAEEETSERKPTPCEARKDEQEPCFLQDDVDTPEGEKAVTPLESNAIIWKTTDAAPPVDAFVPAGATTVESNEGVRGRSSSSRSGSMTEEKKVVATTTAVVASPPLLRELQSEADTSSSSSRSDVDAREPQEAPNAVRTSISPDEQDPHLVVAAAAAKQPPPVEAVLLPKKQKQREPPAPARTRSRNKAQEKTRGKDRVAPLPGPSPLPRDMVPLHSHTNAAVEGHNAKESVLMHLLKETLAMNELLETELQTTKAKLKHNDRHHPHNEKQPRRTPAQGDSGGSGDPSGPSYYANETNRSHNSPYEVTHRAATSSAAAEYNHLLRLVAPQIHTPPRTRSHAALKRTEEPVASGDAVTHRRRVSNGKTHYYNNYYASPYNGERGRATPQEEDEEEGLYAIDVRPKNAIRLRTVSTGNAQRRPCATHRNARDSHLPVRSSARHPAAPDGRELYTTQQTDLYHSNPRHNQYAEETYTYRTKKRTFSRPAAPPQPYASPANVGARFYPEDSRRPQERGRSAGPRLAPREERRVCSHHHHHHHLCQCESPVAVNRHSQSSQQQRVRRGRTPPQYDALRGGGGAGGAALSQEEDLREVERSYLAQCRSVLEQLERMVGQDKS